jgi:hypothetical protein
MGEMRDAYKFLIGEPERKGLLGRHRRRWKNNVKIDPKSYGSVDWIQLAVDRGQ